MEIAQAPYPGGAVDRWKRALGQNAVAGTPLKRTVDQLLHAVWLAEGSGELKFIGLGWSTGQVQPKNCVVPNQQS